MKAARKSAMCQQHAGPHPQPYPHPLTTPARPQIGFDNLWEPEPALRAWWPAVVVVVPAPWLRAQAAPPAAPAVSLQTG